MSRFLYEHSVAHKGHLIIPFVFATVDSQPIYSYTLLSELGHKGKFHKVENPAGLYSSSIFDLIELAKSHLQRQSDVVISVDYFKHRYTYRNDLIIIFQGLNKYFYDHYKSEILNNVAAPKLFSSEQECMNWIKQGLDRAHESEQVEQA